MSVRRCAAWVTTLLSAVWCWGCSGSARAEPRFSSADPTAQEDFDDARRAFEDGRIDEAGELFSSFIAGHRDDPLLHGAELFMGRVAMRREQYQDAAVWFERAAATTDGDLGATARRELGQALLQAGDPDRAMAILEPLAGTLDGSDAAELYGALASAAEASDEPERQIRYLDAYCRYGGRQVREQSRARLATRVAALDRQALERLAGSLPHTGPGWAAVVVRLGAMAAEQGDEDEVRDLLRQVEDAGADDAATPLRASLEQMEQVDWSAIGVLLPLSGRARLIGEQMRAGIEIAASGEHLQALDLVVRDTADADAEGVVRLIDDLVNNEHVAAIVGPVDAAQAEAAAGRAQALGVPLLALSINPDLPGLGQWVLRSFQSNEAEVRALVEYATGSRGVDTFAVLHPDTPYGRVLLRLIEDEVARRGGRVVTARAYPPTLTSFVEPCRELAGLDFEALIVPDRSRTVALIAPALASVGLWSQGPTSPLPEEGRGIQLLVPSSGFDPALPRSAGRYLQGAVFTTVLWTGDTDPVTARFVEAYRATQGSAPSPYASQAHDAIQVLRAARGAAATHGRAALLEALRAIDGADTVGPFDGFDESGEPRTPVRLIELDGASFRWVEP